MEEPFIKWLNTYTEFAEGSELRTIMDDAIKCYKFGIPRPSLMLSYLVFLLAIKSNLLKSMKPDSMSEKEWQNIQNELRNEKRWDDQVLECIKRNSLEEKIVFHIDQSIRTDVEYWKNRRNDCAHYKKEQITLSHVSAFWSFMMSHYNEFTPIGSIQQSINEYNDYFDISKTPVGTDQTEIFNRLVLTIKSKDDFAIFLNGISKNNRKDKFKLINDCLESAIRSFVRDFLNYEEDLCVEFLEVYPDKVSCVWGNSPQTVREYWHNKKIYSVSLKLFIEIMKSGLIPEKERKEAISQLLKLAYESGEDLILDKEEKATLMSMGLEEEFLKYISKNKICVNPGEKCYKTDFYISLIKIIGLTENVVLTLNDSMLGSFPYTLQERIQDEILCDKENKELYKKVCDKHGEEPRFNIT